MPDRKDPLPALDKLQEEIDKAKAGSDTEKQNFSESQEGINAAMRFSVELVAGVLVGSVFGYMLDRWLGTMPVFFIICFFLGAAGGFRNMLRDAKRVDKEDQGKE